MNPYNERVLSIERLRQCEGLETMSDEELELALTTINVMAEFYLNNKNKIDEYGKCKFGAF